ncbi:catabolite repressor/activator [Metapseudomonas furukawaii]|uniref:Fructose repressor FruR n=1 Tax=Metapseudomonas furukawaii TaxID=1149133 RepID=A0AAD1C2G5_METFU|nr:catabolite repressor/activator [Pseudomonas furukawaii]ELS25071.1 Fructose repressor FruR, LacI family [Pseudomonas furukawaii]BAU74872.1 fructose repressor FruR [Pseudomonas furukawaii]
MKLSDIARLAGVSVTTASYVINGKAEQKRISPATVERVQAVVDEHGFKPNPQAAGLRSRQTRTLGFILPDLENPSYARLAKLLEQGARARGYQLLMASSDDEPESERQLLRLFRARRCDALIVASCLPEDDDSLEQLLDEGLPVIALDRVRNPERFCAVVSDDREAARELTRSLLDPVPKRIALLGARPELPTSAARSAGFHDALAGLDTEVVELHGEAFSRDCGRRLMDELLARKGPLPDVLITTAYVLLAGVLDALRERGDWPGDLRVGTFGDTQLLDFLPLPVNSMYQQHGLIAEQVLALALAAVEQQRYEPGVRPVARRLKER